MPWMLRLNAVLGSLVVTVGFWLIWGQIPVALAVALALGATGFLIWQGNTIGSVWAWTTLALGLESLSWPIVTMVRIRMTTVEPTDQQIGDILTSILFGLFSGIFWMTFAYGIFKWNRRGDDREAASKNPGAKKEVNQKRNAKKTSKNRR